MERVRTRDRRFSYTVGRGYDVVRMWRKGVGEESGGGDLVKGRAAALFPFNSSGLESLDPPFGTFRVLVAGICCRLRQ